MIQPNIEPITIPFLPVLVPKHDAALDSMSGSAGYNHFGTIPVIAKLGLGFYLDKAANSFTIRVNLSEIGREWILAPADGYNCQRNDYPKKLGLHLSPRHFLQFKRAIFSITNKDITFLVFCQLYFQESKR